MAYTGSRGYMIDKLKKNGVSKFDGKKVEKLGKQELIALYNKEGK